VSDYIDTIKEDINDPEIDNYNNTALVFKNPIDSETNGLELELDYRINPSLRLIASGAIINIISSSDAISLSAPQHSFSMLVSNKFSEKYNASLGYYFVDEFKWTDARAPQNPTGGPTVDFYTTDDYHALDLRLSRNLRFSQANGSLSLVLKNLLEDYSDYQKAPHYITAPQAIQNTFAYIDFRLNF
jgi:outer membrane receptor protein involved in Fe transport